MSEFREQYYPTVMQSIHLLILYIFIQSLEATQEFSVKRDGKVVVIGPAVR